MQGVLERLRAASWSIQSQFLAYSLALLVPALVFSGLMILRSASFERADIDRQIQDLANARAAALDREFDATISTLMALASSPSLAEGELEAFYGQAKAAAETSGSHFFLSASNGRQLLNTRVAWGAELPTTSSGNWKDVASSGKPAISSLFQGQVAHEPVYAVSVPVTARRRVKSVLSASIPPRRIAGLLSDGTLDEGWVLTATDQAGVIVARSTDSEKYVGQHLRPDQWEARTHPGTWRTKDPEGTDELGATATSKRGGWIVTATVPVAIANEGLTRSWYLVGTMGAAFAILSALLALIFGRRISGPVRQLAAAADALGRGKEIPPIKSSISEIGDVAHAITRAAALRRYMERSVRESESRLRQVLDNVFAFVGVLDLDGRLIESSKASLEAAGLKRDATIGKPFWDLPWWVGSTEAQANLKVSFSRAKAGETVRYDVDFIARDGEKVTIDLQLAPLFDEAGAVILVIVSASDITDRKRREEHIHILMREITHRSKNLLAVIQAMARQSKAGSRTLAEFEARFSARLQALAASHDLLVHRNWRGVDLSELITSQLGHYLDDHTAQIHLAGPALIVAPEAAQNIGLAVHELSTNAAKYGALSVVEGRIDVGWSLVPSADGEKKLRVTWLERGGPPVEAPSQRGFGRTVVEQITPRALHGAATLTFAEEGLGWTLEIPVTHVIGRKAGLVEEPTPRGAPSMSTAPSDS